MPLDSGGNFARRFAAFVMNFTTHSDRVEALTTSDRLSLQVITLSSAAAMPYNSGILEAAIWCAAGDEGGLWNAFLV
jgi:hypothetical protein